MSVCVCILVLVIQNAKRMRHIILTSVACLAVPYFSTLSDKWHDLRGGIIEFEVFFLIFAATLSKKFLILRRNY